MSELSYQQQLWQIVVQTLQNSKINIPEPNTSLSTLLDNNPKHQQSQKSLHQTVKQTPPCQEYHDRDPQIYLQLIQSAETLKTKKLINANKISQFASKLYDTLTTDSKLLTQLSTIINQQTKQILLRVEGFEQELDQSAYKCIKNFMNCQQGEHKDIEGFIQQSLKDHQQHAKSFISLTKQQLPKYVHSIDINMPYKRYEDQQQASFEQYQDNIIQLKQIFSKITVILTEEFKIYSKMSESEEGSLYAHKFLYKIHELLVDMEKFCGYQNSLLNKVLAYSYQIKRMVIQKFAQLYAKHICSNVEFSTSYLIQQHNYQEEVLETTQITCSRGILTQIHIQIYKFLIVKAKFIDSNITKLKQKMGKYLQDLLSHVFHDQSKSVSNTQPQSQSNTQISIKIEQIGSQLSVLYHKVQYLSLLLSGVKTRFLTTVLQPIQCQLLIELQKLRKNILAIQSFLQKKATQYWKGNKQLSVRLRTIKQSISNINTYGNFKINQQNFQLWQIELTDLQKLVLDFLNQLKSKHSTLIVANCVNIFKTKQKQIEALKQKLLLIQLELYDRMKANTPVSRMSQTKTTPNLNKCESRIIEEETQAQNPQNFIKNPQHYMRNQQISLIEETYQSLNNSIEIPVSNRKKPSKREQHAVLIKKLEKVRYNDYNVQKCSDILSETSQFFEEGLKQLLTNGYELYFYQSDNLKHLKNKGHHPNTNQHHRYSNRHNSIHSQQDYSRRVDQTKTKIQNFVSEINQLIESGSSPEMSLQLSNIKVNKKTQFRESAIKIEVEEGSEDEGSEGYNDKNDRKNYVLNLSSLKDSGQQQGIFWDEMQQLKLTINNIFLLEEVMNNQLETEINQNKIINKSTNLTTIINNYLNFQFQNWKSNIIAIELYLQHTLDKTINQLKLLVQIYARSIFSHPYSIYRDYINLQQICLDILTEMVHIYKLTKNNQEKRNKDNHQVELNESDFQYFELLRQLLLKMDQQAQELQNFSQIPMPIRTHLYQLYCQFMNNFKEYVGFSDASLLNLIVNKLDCAVNFRQNHEAIFQSYVQALNQKINSILQTDSISLNKLTAIVNEMKSISGEILMIRDQNLNVIRFDKKQSRIVVKGILQFEDLNDSYSEFYQLAEYITTGQTKSTKFTEPALKTLKQKIQKIYQKIETVSHHK